MCATCATTVDPSALRIGHHHPDHPQPDGHPPADAATGWVWSVPDVVAEDRIEADLYHLPAVAVVALSDEQLLAEFVQRRAMIELVSLGGVGLPADRGDHFDLWTSAELEMLSDAVRNGAGGRYGYDASAQDWDALETQLGGLALEAQRRWGDDGVGYLRGYVELRQRDDGIIERSRDLWLQMSDRLASAGWLTPGADNPLSVEADGDGLAALLVELGALIDRFKPSRRLVLDRSVAAEHAELLIAVRQAARTLGDEALHRYARRARRLPLCHVGAG